jgi:hypothetical protein
MGGAGLVMGGAQEVQEVESTKDGNCAPAWNSPWIWGHLCQSTRCANSLSYDAVAYGAWPVGFHYDGV